MVFFVGLGDYLRLVALAGTWKPELGLDLQGGTRITLIAKGSPDAESLEEVSRRHRRRARQRHRRRREA